MPVARISTLAECHCRCIFVIIRGAHARLLICPTYLQGSLNGGRDNMRWASSADKQTIVAQNASAKQTNGSR